MFCIRYEENFPAQPNEADTAKFIIFTLSKARLSIIKSIYNMTQESHKNTTHNTVQILGNSCIVYIFYIYYMYFVFCEAKGVNIYVYYTFYNMFCAYIYRVDTSKKVNL